MRAATCAQLSRSPLFLTTFALPAHSPSPSSSAGNTLYVDLSTGAHSYGIGIIDVTPTAAQSDSAGPAAATRRDLLKSVIPMPGGTAQMWGMSWDPSTSLLKSVQQSATETMLDWRTLDPRLAPAKWHSRALGASDGFEAVGGNLESIRAFDCSLGSKVT